MTELKTLTKLVKGMLESIPETRNSDDKLYLAICRHKRPDINVGMLCFGDVLLNRELYGFPGFESVRRTRQKVQQAHPELCACERVEEYRIANEEKYRDFAQAKQDV